MNKKTGIIFSDVDGTLYGKEYQILESTKKDIAYAQKHNFEVIIATGNPYYKQMKELGKLLNINYFIASNGAQIVDVKNDVMLKDTKISQEITAKIVTKGLELGLKADWWDENKLYFVKNMNKEVVDFWKARDGFVVELTDQAPTAACKAEFYARPGDEQKLDEMGKYLAQFDLQVARMHSLHMEITMKEVSKGHAIKFLAKHFDFDLAKTMGVGDSANDATMFAVVEHSYAMDNAADEIKKLVKHHTSDVYQNGAGEAIQDFMFRMGFRDEKF